MSVTEDESKLIAIFVQSCLWGGFAVMFVITYWILVYNRPFNRPLNKSMLGVAILMFVLATMQLGINFTRIIRAFITFKGAPGVYWNMLSEFTQVFGSAMYIIQTFVGDAVAVYRAYVVWNRRFHFIAVPIIIYIGSLVAGIGILVVMGQTTNSEIFVDRLRHWIAIFLSCTLATSIICTSMISSRIWYLDRTTLSGRTRGTFHPVARIVLESGAIYSGVLIALISTFFAESWFQYVLVDALSPLIGIVFSIIIVRIGLGVATDPETIQTTRASRIPWSGPQRNAPHELSTFAASGDIEQCKGGDWQSGGVTTSTGTRAEEACRSKDSPQVYQ